MKYYIAASYRKGEIEYETHAIVGYDALKIFMRTLDENRGEDDCRVTLITNSQLVAVADRIPNPSRWAITFFRHDFV